METWLLSASSESLDSLSCSPFFISSISLSLSWSRMLIHLLFISYCFYLCLKYISPSCGLWLLRNDRQKLLLKSSSLFISFTNRSSSCCLQNIVRGCSVLLGPGTSGLWRALAQSQNHIPGGGPAELTDLLEQYAQNLAQNMKLTYLNPVALVAPNLGEFTMTTHTQSQIFRHNTIANH